MSNNIIENHNQETLTKQYQSMMARDHESQFLKICKGTKLVPDVIEETQNSITMLTVKGDSLLSLLEDVWKGNLSAEDGKKWLRLLLEWFLEVAELFQSKLGKLPVLEDSHLKNFILNTDTGKITGVDFEHWHFGNQAECLGIFMAYVDSYKEAASLIAKELSEWLFQEIQIIFHLSPEEIVHYMKKQKELLLQRRKTAYYRKNTTAVILAGGKARRMGQPKDMLLADTYTFFETILYQMQTFDHITASVGKGQSRPMSISQIEDIYADHGPLGALHAVMVHADTEWIFLIACDMPAIKESGLYYLFSALKQEYDCLIPVYGGYHHPLAGIYHKRLLPKVERLLLEENCCMQELLDIAHTYYFNISEEMGMQLYNINTQSDYDIWKRKEQKDDQR